MKLMNDPFEPTPAGFHCRVQQTLHHLETKPRPIRWVAVLAACLVMLCGTAFALERLGVLYFLTERIWQGSPVDASAVVQPSHQQYDGQWLAAAVQDAYWDGEALSLTVHVQPQGEAAFYTETDRGQDGEHFDLIWWEGQVLPYAEWKAGRPSLMLRLPRLMAGDEDITASWDWVQHQQGETLLITGTCDDLSQGATLTLLLDCVQEDTGATEHSVLTFTLPPMTKGDINP